MANTTARKRTATKKTAAKKTAPRIPEGVKQPSDRQEKATEKAPGLLSVEVHGKTWRVPEEALDDFELLDDLHALDQDDDPTRLPAILRRLLVDLPPEAEGRPGRSQWREAMDEIRDKTTGRVTVEAGTVFFYDLMKALNPNSSGS